MTSTNFKEWLEGNIKQRNINNFNYNEFTEQKEINEGGFGVVKFAEWKNRGLKVALKRLKIDFTLGNDDIKEFVKELNLLRKVCYHPNINRIYGVTKDAEFGHYIMVLKYANNGNLRDYLKVKFSTLTLSDKLKMAIEITRGLMCLHTEEIIHRDLHDGNILVNEGRMMIADLGLSKELGNSTISSRSTLFGIPAFIEPQCFIDEKYKRDKRSDMYSLGNLLWEIFSGHPPFESVTKFLIASKILSGERESPIEGTPSEYIKLYQQCWDNNPEKRPKVQQVYDVLISLQQNENGTEIYDEESELQNWNDSSSDDVIESVQSSDTSREEEDDVDIQSNEISDEYEAVDYSSQDISTEKNFISLLIELVQLYSTYGQVGSCASVENYSNWFKNHQSNSVKIFNFVKSTLTRIDHKELIVGIFYKEGFGTRPIRKKQFKWIKEGARKDDMYAIYELGICYEKGHGVEKDYNKAFVLYERAADRGFNTAKFTIANACRNGYFYEVNEVEAFNLYKELVDKGYIGALYELAQCYEYKIGTAVDNKEALRLYTLYFQNGFSDNNKKVEELERTIKTSQDNYFLV